MNFVLAHSLTGAKRSGKERANHKYIKREWNNGRWAYTYKITATKAKSNSKNDSMGYTDRSGNPTEFKVYKYMTPQYQDKVVEYYNNNIADDNEKASRGIRSTTTVDTIHVLKKYEDLCLVQLKKYSYDYIEALVLKHQYKERAMETVNKCSNQLVRNIGEKIVDTLAGAQYLYIRLKQQHYRGKDTRSKTPEGYKTYWSRERVDSIMSGGGKI